MIETAFCWKVLLEGWKPGLAGLREKTEFFLLWMSELVWELRMLGMAE